jgi:hypothetical protein
VSGRKPLLGVWRDAICESELRSTTKLVALVLTRYMSASGYAFPGRATIATSASLTVRAVDSAIEKLELAGFLAVEPPRESVTTKRGVVWRRRGGNSITNKYQATLPETANVVRTSEWKRANETTLNSERHAPNSERGSHESVESAESGALTRRSPNGGDASAENKKYPVGVCEGCGDSAALVDDRSLYCAGCTVKEAV